MRGLGPCVAESRDGHGIEGAGEAGPALVEQEHGVVLHCPAEPAAGLGGSGGLIPGAALQEDEPRQVVALTPGGAHLAGKDLELAGLRP